MSDPKPKPTDYKAEAREWLKRWELRFEHYGIDLAALLERLCGEARTDLHEMRCLLYEDGWDAVGTPQARLLVVIQRWQETRDANRKLSTQLTEAQKERDYWQEKCLLAESATGEAMKEEQSLHALAQQEWGVQLAEAQKEIEQLREDYAEDWDKMNLAIVEMGKRAEKAESAIEQAREEGRREQREKDAETVEDHDYSDRGRAIAQAIREAKP